MDLVAFRVERCAPLVRGIEVQNSVMQRGEGGEVVASDVAIAGALDEIEAAEERAARGGAAWASRMGRVRAGGGFDFGFRNGERENV